MTRHRWLGDVEKRYSWTVTPDDPEDGAPGTFVMTEPWLAAQEWASDRGVDPSRRPRVTVSAPGGGVHRFELRAPRGWYVAELPPAR